MRVSRMLCFFLLLGTLTTLLCAADITGKWRGKSDEGPGWTFNFKSEGNKLTGTMVSAEGKELPIKDAKLDGDALSFSVDSEWQGQPVKLVMTGKVSAAEIQLHIGTEDGSWAPAPFSNALLLKASAGSTSQSQLAPRLGPCMPQGPGMGVRRPREHTFRHGKAPNARSRTYQSEVAADGAKA
jgi:hypothetical protein